MNDANIVDPIDEAAADRLRYERAQRVLAEHGWQIRTTETNTFFAWSPRRAIHLQDLADVECLAYELDRKTGGRE
jgi:hypothetical protein